MRSARLATAGCLASVGCLVILGLLAYRLPSAGHLDAEILSEFTVSNGSFLDFAASLVERIADWLPQVILVAVACLIGLRSGRPQGATAAVVLVAGVALLTQALKVILVNPRYQPILGHHQISSTGFPSGHSAGALALAFAFFFAVPPSWRRPAAAVGAVLVVAVGVSLLALGLHYPSDVLAGWLVAAGWCFAFFALRFARRPLLGSASDTGSTDPPQRL
jgi:membrane-associated phospholipid phosphatase